METFEDIKPKIREVINILFTSPDFWRSRKQSCIINSLYYKKDNKFKQYFLFLKPKFCSAYFIKNEIPTEDDMDSLVLDYSLFTFPVLGITNKEEVTEYIKKVLSIDHNIVCDVSITGLTQSSMNKFDFK